MGETSAPLSKRAAEAASAPVSPDGQLQGYIHAVESGSAVDGPGIRYVLFLSGCPLHCQYCHNPDSWRRRSGALRTLSEVMAPIRRSAPMLKRMGGGLTISGGEPLVQHEFTQAVFAEAKKLGLHTALDTSGFLGERATDEMLQHVDLVLLDIKSKDPEIYKRTTGVDIAPTLAFAQRLAAIGKPTWVRFVLVPGLTDAPANVAALGAFVAGLSNVERFEVLPFHKMGEHKWAESGRVYKLANVPPPSLELIERVRTQLRDAGVAEVC